MDETILPTGRRCGLAPNTLLCCCMALRMLDKARQGWHSGGNTLLRVAWCCCCMIAHG